MVERNRDQERRAMLRLVTRLGAIAAVIAAAFNLLLFFQTGAWQMLAVAGGTGIAIACLVPATLLARRGSLDAAGYWALSGMLFAFAMAETFHSGITPYLLVGGILLTLVVGYLVLPNRWWIVVIAAVLYIGHVWIMNSLEPLPRYDMRQLGGSADIFAIVLVGFLFLSAMWGLVRAYRRIVAIRTRLPLSFVLVVLLPALIIITAVAVVGSRNGEQQAVNQLESVASIKEAEIGKWLESLENDLSAALAGSQVAPRALVLLQSLEPSDAQKFYLRSHLQQVVEQTERFQDMRLLNSRGQVVLATDVTQEDADYGDQALFRNGLAGFYLEPPVYSASDGQVRIAASFPVLGPDGQAVGVLAGSVNQDSLREIMGEQAWVGNTGEIYLVDRDQNLLTEVRKDWTGTRVDTEGARVAVQTQASGSATYQDYNGENVIAFYTWLPELQGAMVAKQDRSEALSITFSLLGIVGGVAVGAVAVAVAVSLLVTRGIARPLANLTDTASQIAAGNLALRAPVEGRDEISALAGAFNTMTARLRDLIGSLEERVAERTRELEQRSAYLEASADVARAAGSVLDPDDLVRQTVDLIRDRFDLYYVGLFLADEAREWAILSAGTGEAGRAMLARGHRIRVGEGMVGWSIANAQARIASRAEADAVRLAIPELPETRSEAALPLRSRGQVLGALSVQDTDPEVFDEEMIVVLQTMADQVAVAHDNARLFAASQQALQAERLAYGEISREAWAHLVGSRVTTGYRADELGVAPAAGSLPPEVRQAVGHGQAVLVGDDRKPGLAVPIPVRDQVIGTLKFHKPGGGDWTEDEVALLEGMAAQLGQALEGARLYQDTQRRAARERLVGEVTARMRETLDMDIVLKTAVREMQQALGLARVEARVDVGVEERGRANGTLEATGRPGTVEPRE